MLTEFADLIAQPGERHLIYGGTRAGKSSFIDWQIREIQRTRPDCMQILVDSKPRFRAETERGWSGPKAEEAPRGAISIGEKVQSYPTLVLWTSMQKDHFADSGPDLVKSPSCSREIPKTGDACFFFFHTSSRPKSETENDTFTPMKSWTSMGGRRTAS